MPWMPLCSIVKCVDDCKGGGVRVEVSRWRTGLGYQSCS